MSCNWKHVCTESCAESCELGKSVCTESCELGKPVCIRHLHICTKCFASDELIDAIKNKLCEKCEWQDEMDYLKSEAEDLKAIESEWRCIMRTNRVLAMAYFPSGLE
jgi:hypothetical protein